MKGMMLLGLLAVAGVANADTAAKPACETNYKQEGSFFGGRRFSTFDVLAGVDKDVAYKRVYAEMMKSGFKVTNSDRDMGMLASEYVTTHNGASITLPLNVVIEPEGKGIKVTVNKTTPGGYATSQDFQVKQMCAVIDTANGK
ncbi:MAG TPA: hypothetical protein VGD21_15345 [Lysobacter sp.]